MIKKSGIVCGLIVSLGAVMSLAGFDLRRQFYTEYYAWKVYTQTDGAGSSDPTDNVHFQNILAMGPPVVPFVIHEMEQSHEWRLDDAVSTITKKRFTIKDKSILSHPGARAKLYIQWWYQGRQQTPQEFNELFSNWKECKLRGDKSNAGNYLIQIKRLGLPVLPMLVDKIEDGMIEFIPLVEWLTNGRVKLENLSPDNIRVWWERNKACWTLPER